MTEVAGQRFRLYTTADLEAVIARMARQTLALLDPDQRPVVVGVLRRGAPLADRLVAAIAALNPAFNSDILGRAAGSTSKHRRNIEVTGRTSGPRCSISARSLCIDRSRNDGRRPVARCSIVAANDQASAPGPISPSPSSSSGLA